MNPWRQDPIPALLRTGDEAIEYAVRHDLGGERLDPVALWDLKPAARLLRGQRPDGSWQYPGGSARIRSAEDYAQVETYKRLLELVGKYRLDQRHPSCTAAVEFILSRQTPEGDIRGIYGNQYTPNYTAAMLALCVEAGYSGDRRVTRGLDWLLSMRQDDGAWALPTRTLRGPDFDTFARAMKLPEPVLPDRSRRGSHLITGIVLRALTAHPRYRHRPETRRAARWLVSRFFEPDAYSDHHGREFWTKLAYPFRWTDLVSSLDVVGLARIGDNEGVVRAFDWLVDHQGKDDLWRSGYASGAQPLAHQWVTVAVARLPDRFGNRDRSYAARRTR